MTVASAYTAEIQKLADLQELEEAGGASAVPQYLAADGHMLPVDEHGSDSVVVNLGALSNAAQAAITAAETAAPQMLNNAEQVEEEQYLANTLQYTAVVEGEVEETEDAPPPPPPPPTPEEDGGGTEGTSGSGGTEGTGSTDGSYDGTDAFNGIDEELDDIFGGFDESDFIDEDGDGDYDTLNEEAMKEFTERIMAVMNRLLGLTIALSLKQEIMEMLDEKFSGQPIEKNSKSQLRANVLKIFSGVLKAVQMGFSKLMEKINAHNEEIYNQKVEDAKEKQDSTGFKAENWWKAGEPAEELTRELCREQVKYLKALNANVEAFQAIIEHMIELMSEGMEGSSDETVQLMTAVVSGMKRMVAAIEESSALVESKLEEAEQAVEDMAYIDSCEAGWDKLCEGGWDNFWEGLSGMLRAAQNWMEDIPVLNVISYTCLEPMQQIMGLTQNPVEFVLRIVEGILDLIAMALDYIGEFVDKLIWTIFGGIYDSENWTSGDGWDKTWTDWSGDDSYGTHGIGDLIQWVGRVVVDDILDNLILDNIVDAIRFVLYEVVQRAIDWINDNVFGGHEVIMSTLDHPGSHDYFGFEIDLSGGAGGNYNGDEESSLQGGVSSVVANDGGASAGVGAGFGAFLDGVDGASYDSGGKALKWDKGGTYDPSDIQDLKLDVLIKGIRGEIIRAQNAYRMALAISFLKADLRNIVYSELTGLSGFASHADLIAAAAEITIGPATQIVDAALTQLMMRANVYNNLLLTIDSFEKLEAARGAQVASVILTVVALVLAIVIIAYTAGAGTAPAALLVAAAVVGVCAAMSNMIAQQILAEIDPYTIAPPEVDEMDDPKKLNTSKTVNDVFNAIDQEILSLENSLATGNGFMVKTKDGMLRLDYKAIANLERKLSAMNNAIRTLFYMLKEKRDLARLVKAVFGGSVGDSSGEGLVMKAMESMLAQRQAVVSAITFQLSQFIAAKNLATQTEQALNKTNQGAATSGIAAVGSLLGCIPGLGAAGAIAGAAVTIAGGLINIAISLSNDKLNMTFQSNDQELDAYLEDRASGDNSFESKLDRLEAEAMLNFLENGLMGTGDGYQAVNSPLMAQTLKKIQQIYQIKQVMADLIALTSHVRAVVQKELTGVAPGTSAEELTKATITSNCNASLRMLGNLANHMKTTASVLNEARDAEKEMITGVVAGSIQVAAGTLGVVGAAAGEAGSALANVGQIAPMVGNVVSSLVQLIMAAVSAASDNGELAGYDVDDTVDGMGVKQDKGKHDNGDWAARLDAEEEAIYRQMGTELLQSMNGSMMGVSPDSSLLTSKMNRLYNLKAALAMTMNIMREVKAAMGHFQYATSLADVIESNRASALAILGALKDTLETIAERENQKTQETMQAIQSAISLAASAATLGCAAAKIDIANQLKDPDVADADAGALQDTARKLDKAIAGINFLSKIAIGIVPACFDQAAKDSPTEARQIEGKPEATKHGKKKEKGEKSENSGFAASMDSMDQDIAYHEFSLAQTESAMSVLAYNSRNAEAAFNFLKGLPQDVLNLVEAFINKQQEDLPDTNAQQDAGAAAAAANGNPSAAAAGTTPVNPTAPEQQAAPSTTLALEQAKQTLERVEQSIAEAQTALNNAQTAVSEAERNIQGLEAQAAQTADPAVRQTREERIANLKLELQKKKEELAAKQEVLTGLIRDKADAEATVGQAATVLPQQEAELNQQNTALRTELGEISDKVAQLTEKVTEGTATPAEEQELAQLQTRQAEIRSELGLREAAMVELLAQAEDLKGEAVALNGRVSAVRGEVAALAREVGNLQRQITQLEREQNEETGSTEAGAAATVTTTTDANTREAVSRIGQIGAQVQERQENIDESQRRDDAALTPEQAPEDVVVLSAPVSASGHDSVEHSERHQTSIAQLSNMDAPACALLLGRMESGQAASWINAIAEGHGSVPANPEKAAQVRQQIVNRQGRDFFSAFDRRAMDAVIPAAAANVNPGYVPLSTPVTPRQQEQATRSTSVQAYDDWIETMKVGAERLEGRTQAISAPVAAEAGEISQLIETAQQEDARPVSREEQIEYLKNRIEMLKTTRQEAVRRYEVLRRETLPQARANAAAVTADISRQIDAVRGKQVEIGGRIATLETLEENGTITPEQRVELTGLRERANELRQARTRLESMREAAQSEVEECRQQIQAVKQEIEGLQREIAQTVQEKNRLQASAPRSEQRAERSDTDRVVAVRDPGGRQSGNGQGGQQGNGGERRNPFGFIFGNGNDGQAVRTAANSSPADLVGQVAREQEQLLATLNGGRLS